MIDLQLLVPGKHGDTPSGALFVPVAKDEQRFLSGRINDNPVLVSLEGERPFHVAETGQWSRSPGLFISDGRFQVEVASAVPVHSANDIALGALVLSPLGTMLIAEDDNGKKGVLLASGSGPTNVERGDVAFGAWRIITGNGETISVHFEHPQT